MRIRHFNYGLDYGLGFHWAAIVDCALPSPFNGGSFPPPALTTRLRQYCEPLRHPYSPAGPPRAARSPKRDHRWGAPYCAWSPLLACRRRQYPGRFDGACSLAPLRVFSLPRNADGLAPASPFRVLLNGFTHGTACTLAESPGRPSTPKAPTVSLPPPPLRIATGWSEPAP